MSAVDIAMTLICLLTSVGLWLMHRFPNLYPKVALGCQAYILRNQVTHARCVPSSARHSFTYPTTSFLFSLRALESNSLDLFAGRLFGYGGTKACVTGLRPDGYLMDSEKFKGRSIREKMSELLKTRGFDDTALGEVWIMTMPSFMGFEGINPLTVYFCYSNQEAEENHLWIIVLEVHNTFGERHVYILQTGRDEDGTRPPNFDHQWTFPRQFHVSPFNDRSGYYVCSIIAPSHPPLPKIQVRSPRPIIKLNVMTPGANPEIKLTAILQAKTSTPFTASSLIFTLLQAPFALLLTFPRIAYQAFILHYRKRLDVYVRPEPIAVRKDVEESLPPVTNAVQPGGRGNEGAIKGGIGWQKETWVERWCRKRVERFMEPRAAETNVITRLICSNPLISDRTFGPSDSSEARVLDIYYRSPRFFATLIIAPSPRHMLVLGSTSRDPIFSPSSKELFLEVFSNTGASYQNPIRERLAHARLEKYDFANPLDAPSLFMLSLVLLWTYCVDKLTELIFNLVSARFVPGEEPRYTWKILAGMDDIDGKNKASSTTL